MKRAIITGAGGFVGRALCAELSKHNIPITAIIKDNEESRYLSHLPNITQIQFDLSEAVHLAEALGDTEDETVFYHLAWQGTAGPERCDYRLQLDNVQMTVEALKTAEKMGCECFVGAGSLMEHECTEAVYNTNEKPGMPNIYSTAKLTAHYMSRIIAADMNIRFVWPYITNAYGEDETSPRFFNATVKKLLSGEELKFSAATQLYDFIHVSDAARAFRLIGDKGKNGMSYCIGSGKPRSLKEYILEMRDLLAPGRELEFGDKPGISVDAKYFDTAALKADTGFEAKVTFNEGIQRMATALRSDGR